MKDRVIPLRVKEQDYLEWAAVAAKMRRTMADTMRFVMHEAYERITNKGRDDDGSSQS